MKILEADGVILTHDGNDLYAPNIGEVVSICFTGVSDSSTRPLTINFSNLTKFNKIIRSNLSLDFPDEVGFLVFAIPYAASKRNTWYITDNNRGPIGGSPDGPLANLFPDPGTQEYNGNMYWLYISSYITNVKRPIIVSV